MTDTTIASFLADLAGNWWTLLVRGLLIVLFGLIALFSPGTTLFVLVLFFAACALVDGVLAVTHATARNGLGARAGRPSRC